jgi:hypothetical protein
MRAHVALAIVAALAVPAEPLLSQSITVSTTNGTLRVQAPGFHFIVDDSLARLKDGQSVRADLELAVFERPGGARAAQHRQACVLSYDLWEERFAVSLAGVPSRSISHVTLAAAETWCVQQIAVPVSALGPLARNVPFWVRLEARVINDSSAEREEDGFTLRSLIDALSRRRKTSETSHAIEAGPFRVQE